MAKGDDYLEELWSQVVDPSGRGEWIGEIFTRWEELKRGPFWRTGPALKDLLEGGASKKDLAKLGAFVRHETCFSLLVALDDPGLGTGKIAGICRDFLRSRPKSKARNKREEFCQWLWETEDFLDDNGRWLKDIAKNTVNVKPFQRLYPAVQRLLQKPRKLRDLGIFMGWNRWEACVRGLHLLEVAGFQRGDEPVYLHEEFDSSYPDEKPKKSKSVPSGTADRTEPLWHIKAAQALAFSPDGKTLAVAGASSPIRLYDLATGMERLACEGTRVHIYEIVFSPDGKQVTAGQIRKEISICDAKTGKLLHKINAKTKGVPTLDQDISGLEYVSTGELIRSCWRGEIEIFDPKTGKVLPPFRVNDNDDKVDAIALFQEGTRWAVLCDDSVSVWSWPNRKLLLQFKAGGWQSRIAVSPDGKTIAVSEDEKDVQLFESANGTTCGRIKSRGGKHLVFTPDGERLIISHDSPDEISIWNVKNTKQVCRFSIPDCVFVLDVSANGEYLGAATGRGAFVWRLQPPLKGK